MRESFTASMKPLLAHEGGYSNHPNDPGGPTFRGITQRVYDGYRVTRGHERQSVRHLTDAEYLDIYRRNYWNAVRADELPLGIDYCVFDGAVNSGPGQSVKWLQRAIDVVPDGVVGSATIAKLEELHADEDRAGDILIDKICDQRLAFMRSLRNYPSFKKGWETRVRDVRKIAKQMNNHQPMSEPVALLADETGKALPSETRISDTPVGDATTKQTSSGIFAIVMGYVNSASDYLSLLTGLPQGVIQVAGAIGLTLGVAALCYFASRAIYETWQRRKRGESVEAE